MENSILLICEAKSGNEVAFAKLCEQYNNLLESMSQKFSTSSTKEYASVDDFFQEAMVAFYKAVLKYDPNNSKVTFGAFAKVCIRNRLVSYIRKLNSKKRHKGEDDAEAIKDSPVQDTVVRRELGEKLISAANGTLSKFEKKVFSYYLKGRRAKEISSLVGKDEKSVNNAIYRIRSKLKKTVL